MCNYSGYVKFFRKIQNWEWYKDIPCFKLFVHCLVRANFDVQYFKGKKIEAGSFITTYRNLAFETGLTVNQVRLALKKLEITHNITQKSHTSNTVITINNWEQYQENNTQQHTEITLIKEYKEDKNIRNNTTTYIGTNNICEKKSKIFQKPTVEEIRNYCLSRNNNVNPNLFYDYYESNGWQVGKNKMKDWKAAVRTWENKKGYNDYEKPKQQTIKYRTV